MIVGVRIAPIRKLRLVLNSMQVRPRVVDISRTRRPSSPEIRKVTIVRKIIIMIEIFE